MKVTYDSEVDAIYIELQSGDFAENKEVMDGVILDIGDNGKLLGIEILNASSVIARDELGRISVEIPVAGKKPVA
jgi:uncharacterized protein YuzE